MIDPIEMIQKSMIYLQRKINGLVDGNPIIDVMIPGFNLADVLDTEKIDEIVKKHVTVDANGNKGKIEFRNIEIFPPPTGDESDSSSPSPSSELTIFQYPPIDRISDINPGWGVEVCVKFDHFSVEYDFTGEDFFVFKINDIKIRFLFKSSPPEVLGEGTTPLPTVIATPAIALRITVMVPRDIEDIALEAYEFTGEFPDIVFELPFLETISSKLDLEDIELENFRINFDINFPIHDGGDFLASLLEFEPFHLNFPSWLKWKNPSVNFGDLLRIEGSCNWTWGVVTEKWMKFKTEDTDIETPVIEGKSFVDVIIEKLCAAYDWVVTELPKHYFTHTVSAGDYPSWMGVYFNFSGEVGPDPAGNKPNQFHFMLGLYDDLQVTGGFLTCTDRHAIFQYRSLVYQAYLQYDYQKNRLGFVCDILTPDNIAAQALMIKAGYVPSADIGSGDGSGIDYNNIIFDGMLNFVKFGIRIEKLAVFWEIEETAFVFTIDGTLKVMGDNGLLKNVAEGADNQDVKLPFKKIGFKIYSDPWDIEFVMNNAWVKLKKAMEIQLDDIKTVHLLLSDYGYGYDKAEDDYWFGFSGGIRLPKLNCGGEVKKLILHSNKDTELSGVKIELEVEEVFSLDGAAEWFNDIEIELPGVDDIKGFGAELTLSIHPINLTGGLGFTYVKVSDESGDSFVAWSLKGIIILPTAIPVSQCLGINAFGGMLAWNYLPKAKSMGLPVEKWFEQGFDSDTDNILNFLEYWNVEKDVFSIGFRIGVCTISDGGYIINAIALLTIITEGPIVMIAGKVNVLSRKDPSKYGIFDLLIVYDNDDPGIFGALGFSYNVSDLVSVRGTAEFYFDFDDPDAWYFNLGTPEKPISAIIFKIFDAKSYLTIDSRKLTAGVIVSVTKTWSFGPLYVRAHGSTISECVISWNPVFTLVTIKIRGEISASAFGFGFSLTLRADLAVKAPSPWYLEAETEATFSIDALLLSWSYTAHLRFEWGENGNPPRVFLGGIFKSDTFFTASSCSLRSYLSLVPKNTGAGEDGGAPADDSIKIPMDGVIGFQFDRDIEILDSHDDFPELIGDYSKEIQDEVSEHAQGIKRFHAMLKDFRILRKTGDAYVPEDRDIFFCWLPQDEAERKKLITREFDRGFCQFRLNDDPNTFVKLFCPELYHTKNLLSFHRVPFSNKDCAVDTDIKMQNDVEIINVEASNFTGLVESFRLLYPDFTVLIKSDGFIPFEVSGTDYLLIVSRGNYFEFSIPAACIKFSFKLNTEFPDELTPDELIANCLTLYDELGTDITNECINYVKCPDGLYIVTLNHFNSEEDSDEFEFYTQQIPRYGVKKVEFKVPVDFLFPAESKLGFGIELYPLEALIEVKRRNQERIEQEAYLDYVFEQNGDDQGKALWEVGDYNVRGETKWKAGEDEHNPEAGIPYEIAKSFTVIPPFDKNTTVKVDDEDRPVHPFSDYVCRFTPINGSELFYRHQYPGVTFLKNYINAMLEKSDRRLAMVLFDSADKPLKYKEGVFEFLNTDEGISAEIAVMSECIRRDTYHDLKTFYEEMVSFIPGFKKEHFNIISRNQSNRRKKKALRKLQEKTTRRDSHIKVAVLSREQFKKEVGKRIAKLSMSGDAKAKQKAAELRKWVSLNVKSKWDDVVMFIKPEVLFFGVYRYYERIAEYRYTNDDLKLDVSTITFADCMGDGVRPINAYERGFFSPIIPEGAIWNGPGKNTKCTAKIYCPEKDTAIGDVDLTDDIYSFIFSTSLHSDPDDLNNSINAPDIKETLTDVGKYNKVISLLKPETEQSVFVHPGDSDIGLNIGVDWFRMLYRKPAVDIDGKSPHMIEHLYDNLLTETIEELFEDRKREGLLFETLMDTMDLNTDDTDQIDHTRIYWIRTIDTLENEGVVGALIEFPEPIDWTRTALKIDSFNALVEDEIDEKDLLDLPEEELGYHCSFHLIRSLDGTKLLLIPKLTKVFINRYPVIVPDREVLEIGLRDEDTFDITDEVIEIERSDVDLTEARLRASGRDRLMRDRVDISEYAMPSLLSKRPAIAKEKLTSCFGTKVTKNIYQYSVSDCELSFYYFSHNYEDAADETGKNKNYRPIHRLKFKNRRMDDSNRGYIGKLSLL